MFSIIVARDLNNGIGYKGNLLIHLPQDLKYFKDKTTDKTIIMGRKTFERLPNKEPLPHRTNIILTRNVADFLGTYDLDDNMIVSNDINAIIDKYKDSEEEVFVIGGENIYKEFLPYCKNIYVTEIYGCFKSDAYFNFPYNPVEYDKILVDTKTDEKTKLSLDFVKYTKK